MRLGVEGEADLEKDLMVLNVEKHTEAHRSGRSRTELNNPESLMADGVLRGRKSISGIGAHQEPPEDREKLSYIGHWKLMREAGRCQDCLSVGF